MFARLLDGNAGFGKRVVGTKSNVCVLGRSEGTVTLAIIGNGGFNRVNRGVRDLLLYVIML